MRASASSSFSDFAGTEGCTTSTLPLVTAGVTETDPAKRAAIYKQIQDMDYDEVLAVRIYVPTTPFYMQRWVKGFYLNPLYSEEEYYYVLSKD